MCGAKVRIMIVNLKNSWTIKKQKYESLGPVAHACNSGYSEGRDQEECSSNPTQAISYMRHYLKQPFTKIGLVEWLSGLRWRPWVQAPGQQKKEKVESKEDVIQD
jgi:hypothetical protein